MAIRRCVQAAVIAAVALFMMAGSASATPVCLNSTTLAALIALGPTGCQIQNLIFSNFVYTPTGGDVTAPNVTASAVANPVTMEDGWSFNPSNAGAWIAGFTLTYTVTVDPTQPLIAIVSSKDQMNSGLVPNGITITDTQTAGVLNLLGTAGGETQYLGPYNLAALNTSSVGVVPSGKALTSYEQDFFEGSAVPEPATLSLIGGALLGLGILGRKRFSRQ